VVDHQGVSAGGGETEFTDQPPSIFRSWPVTVLDSSERK
jgi:hypothetical protein